MSNNRSKARRTVAVSAPKINMGPVYLDFFEFILEIVDPILPESIKSSEAYQMKNTILEFLKTPKGVLMVNAAIGKAFKSESFVQSANNLTALVDETPEGTEKLNKSVTELKTAATTIKEHCFKIEEIPEDELREKIEKFCLFISLIQDQFLRK